MRATWTCLLAAGLCASAVGFAADGEAERSRTGGDPVAHWHFGPFFDYRRAEPGPATFWAFRPFYSQVRDPQTDTTTRDFLWPLGTWHDHNGAAWWRALIAYGDGRDDDPSGSFNIFPLWFCGTDRDDENYWGLFPIYGHHPHMLLMDDWEYALWPLWHTYTVKGVRSHAVLWPLVTWRDAPRAGVGVWPFYGYATQRESEHAYCLWPIATWASYREDRDTSGAGASWMFWPLYGQIRRARESQTLVLPPFFSYTETDSATRWRLPWPLVEVLRSRIRDRVSVWPFYEGVESYAYTDTAKAVPEENTWRLLWQLVENTELETNTTYEKRFNFFPFFTWERRYRKLGVPRRPSAHVQTPRWIFAKAHDVPTGRDGVSLEEVGSYIRIWPFYSSSTENGLTRRRTLDLILIRHSEGFDRNWSPFWSLWESVDYPDGRTRHLFFFNFIPWTTERKAVSE